VEAAVRAGRLRPVIRGWYATAGAHPDVVRALQLGGRAGCVSSLAAAGAWRPPDPRLHVAMSPSASGRRLEGAAPDELAVHWHGAGDVIGSAFPASPPEAGIRHLVSCQPSWFTVAVLDSLIQRRMMSENRLRSVLASTSAPAAALAEYVDGRSESGIESIARYRLALCGVRAEPQVVLPGIGRVDLLIDDWLVVELDGREFHAQEAAFAKDRRRANSLYRDGKLVLQFDYASVVHDWATVQATILSTLAMYAPVR
jgi:very-short-patch-repair endonuclease